MATTYRLVGTGWLGKRSTAVLGAFGVFFFPVQEECQR